MAITAGAVLVTATASKASAATSFSATYTAITVAANAVGLVVVATDNAGTTSGMNVGNEHKYITDSFGNSWGKLAEYCNAQGAAAGGVTLSVWICQKLKQTAQTTSNTIVVNFSSSVTAKSIQGFYFTVGAGNTLIPTTHAFSTVTNGGAASLSTPTQSSVSRLYMRFGGAEAVTVAPTATTNFTAAGNGTTGTPTAGNMSSMYEYRIVTATTATSAPTWVTGSDQCAILFAFEEVLQYNAAPNFLMRPF